MPGPLDRRFVTVIGKGGVGKTTVAAALAFAAARRGRRVLLATVRAKDRLGDMLGTGPVGPHNREILPGIDAVNLEPEACIEEYTLMTLKVRSIYRLVFGNKFVRSMLAAVPGLYAWAVLGKATYHAIETDSRGRPRYDLVVLDAPATGNGLELLRVPLTLVESVPAGPIHREAAERWALLTDPARHEVLVVTIAEELAVTETAELVERLRRLGLPTHTVIANRLLPPLLSAEDQEILARLDLAGPAGEVIEAGRTRAGWQRVQTEQLARLSASVPLRQVLLPHMLVPRAGPEAIEALSRALEAMLAPVEPGRSSSVETGSSDGPRG